MKITDPAKVMPASNHHHVDVRKLYESPRAMAVVITLKSAALKSISRRLMHSFTLLKDPVLLKLAMRNRRLEKTC